MVAIEAYRGCRYILPLVRHLAAKWPRVVNVTPRSLYRQEGNPMHIKWETWWVWTFRERHKSLTLTDIQTLDRPARSSHYIHWATPAPICAQCNQYACHLTNKSVLPKLPGERSRYRARLRTGQYGIRIPVRTLEFSPKTSIPALRSTQSSIHGVP
jgi:hypothetical protein